MKIRHWLVKSEPYKYSWADFVKEKRAIWDGVRNYQARNNLLEMGVGDLALFYHSNEGLAVMGIARVVRAAYPDPSTDDARWVAVDLEPVQPLPCPVSLATLRQDPRLQQLALLRQSRLSVSPVQPEAFDVIVALGHEKTYPAAHSLPLHQL